MTEQQDLARRPDLRPLPSAAAPAQLGRPPADLRRRGRLASARWSLRLERLAFDYQVAAALDGQRQDDPVPHTSHYTVGEHRVHTVLDSGARSSLWWATKSEWIGLLDVVGLVSSDLEVPVSCFRTGVPLRRLPPSGCHGVRGRGAISGMLRTPGLSRSEPTHTEQALFREGGRMDPSATRERAEALLRELRHLQDGVRSLMKGPRSDIQADQDLVTGRQGHAVYLIRSEPMSMGQLARALGVQPASATAVCDQLVNLGLAERLREPADRRIVKILATDRGRDLIRDRNVWEARALDALAQALEEIPDGTGLRSVDELMRIIELASEIALSANDPSGAAVAPISNDGERQPSELVS
ncbi:MAG: MarR family transcriptional regulator [Acidimicrobiales bacterium]